MLTGRSRFPFRDNWLVNDREGLVDEHLLGLGLQPSQASGARSASFAYRGLGLSV